MGQFKEIAIEQAGLEPEFRSFNRIARLAREMIVTEKIDGTNAQIHIVDDGSGPQCKVLAASRTRYITPDDDNFGFAAWVRDHEEELRVLGPGRWYGEWWGPGIQRGYGLAKRHFSLFNVSLPPERIPACCALVPVLCIAPAFDTATVDECLQRLREHGSSASPGFMRPEGVVVFHPQSQTYFKKTLEGDEEGKEHRARRLTAMGYSGVVCP